MAWHAWRGSSHLHRAKAGLRGINLLCHCIPGGAVPGELRKEQKGAQQPENSSDIINVLFGDRLQVGCVQAVLQVLNCSHALSPLLVLVPWVMLWNSAVKWCDRLLQRFFLIFRSKIIAIPLATYGLHRKAVMIHVLLFWGITKGTNPILVNS